MKKLSLFTAGFAAVTIFIGYELGTIIPNADATDMNPYGEDISITINQGCLLSANDGDFSTSLDIGTYDDDIGSTSFSVVCNDTLRWEIYAIGDSSDPSKKSAMIETSDSSKYIPAGTATSGETSSWSMKIIKGTSATDDMIVNGFDSFSAVPDSSTQIAVMPSGFSPQTSVHFSTKYAVYMGLSQPIGQYQGKVKYTVIHSAVQSS